MMGVFVRWMATAVYGDIQDSFASMSGIVDWVGDNAEKNGMIEAAGPGHFNDPG